VVAADNSAVWLFKAVCVEEMEGSRMTAVMLAVRGGGSVVNYPLLSSSCPLALMGKPKNSTSD